VLAENIARRVPNVYKDRDDTGSILGRAFKLSNFYSMKPSLLASLPPTLNLIRFVAGDRGNPPKTSGLHRGRRIGIDDLR